MSARLARLALALYPLAYRRRYGAEMEALVEDQGASPRAAIDLLRGAAVAHLRPEPALAQVLAPDDLRKLRLSSTLLCWAVFSVVGLALYKTTEGAAFAAAGDAHAVLGAAHLAIQILALIAGAALVLGAIQIAVAARGHVRDRRSARRAVTLAVGCVALLAAATVALVVVAQANSVPGGIDAAILAIWAGLALACGIGGAAAGRLALFAVDLPGGALRVGTALATVATFAMVGIALATGVYLVVLVGDAPGLAGQANGPLGHVSVGASLAFQLAAMLGVCAWSGSRLRVGTTGR